MRPSALALPALVLAMALPANATAGTVAVDGKRLEIETGKGQNRLLIGLKETRIRVEERNKKESLSADGPECTAATTAERRVRVECDASGLKQVAISTGGGNDVVWVAREAPFAGERGSCRGSALGATVSLRAGGGHDFAELSDAPDLARGGAGRDILMGCAGNDRLKGGDDRDRVSGDRGDDDLGGQAGDDSVIGCAFDPDDVNYPRGEAGADRLRGGGGDDFLYGCGGTDAFDAGEGDDVLNTRDARAETPDCGSGDDLIYRDSDDAGSGCEVTTTCTTDNFPFACRPFAPAHLAATRAGTIRP